MDEVAAAEAYAGFLQPDLTWEFPITGLDRVGLPVWSVWRPDPAHPVGGIGYGLTVEAARVGALGETVEQFAAQQTAGRIRRDRGSFREMVAARGGDHVVDPRTLGLPAGVEFDDDRPLHWATMNRLRDGEPVLVPAEFVASSGAELPVSPSSDRLTVPISNGKGAGSSLQQAVRHAVLEILQRDGNGLVFRAMDAGVVLDLGGVKDPITLQALSQLKAAGIEVVAKLAGCDFGIPNLYVVGAGENDDVLTATACGEAVHPDREVALRKAVLEFASARARKAFMHGPLEAVAAVAPPGYLEAALPALNPADEEHRVLTAMLQWLRTPAQVWRTWLDERILCNRRTVLFDALPDTPDLDPVKALTEAGFDILVLDQSPGNGVHAVKVVIPGMEVETVAYARIGERNVRRLLDQGRSDLVRIGDRPPGWARIQLQAGAVERLGGPAWLDTGALKAVAGELLPLYREPSRHTAAQVLADAGPRG